MNKLLSLLKATMSGGIQLFNYRGKTERSRRTMPILLSLLMGVVMLFSANSLVLMLRGDGKESAVLSLYTLITTVIILTESIYKSEDLLFKPRDNDMLLAMPIKKSVVVLVRVIKFYVFELLYCLIFLLPAIVAYAMNCTVEPSYYLLAITMLLLIPIIPIAISCIVGLASSAISARFKHRTFWRVILSFAALIATAVFAIAAGTTSDLGSSLIEISDRLTKFYYPASTFTRLVANFDIWQFLVFVAINLATLTVTIFLIGKFYFQIITRLNAIQHVENKNIKYKFMRHSQTLAMIKKELIKYFSTPVLLMNTAIGLALFVVAIVALCVQYDSVVASLADSVENFPLTNAEIWSYMPSVAFMMVTFASLMTLITATTISLEGKTFNFLKTLPISGKKVIITKVLAAVVLIVPVTILGSLIMYIRFHFEILDGLLVVIAAVVIPLVTELIGILIDLKYARFDAENDAVVVKQSAGVLVATFLGLGLVLITISLTFTVVFLTGQTAGMAMIDAIFVVVAAFLYLAVATNGEEKYTKLAA